MTQEEFAAMTPEELDAFLNELPAWTPYDQRRQMEYPPITDYLDGVVKGDQSLMQAYIDACLAIKAKYPKPTE